PIHHRKLPSFPTRRSSDLEMVDAALGTEIEVQTVDGKIKMKVPAGTQSGTDFKLSNHGVPHLKKQTRGAHIVTVIVETPKKLTRSEEHTSEPSHVKISYAV